MPKFTFSHIPQDQWLYRFSISLFLLGQVMMRVLQGKIHRGNVLEQMAIVGWGSLFAVLLINSFTGVLFTVQMCRELEQFGASSLVGSAFALGYCRELAPILVASLIVGEVSSAFAAEIGEMQVTEQLDALYMLQTDPVNYLVVPRVVACCIMLPVLTMLAMSVGLLGGVLSGVYLYGLPAIAFLNALQASLAPVDLLNILLKSFAFGAIAAITGCGWGLTTTGGAKGVSKSTKAAVVNGWLFVFAANFVLTLLMR
jgi:phospholipid/cholesterol/gamma-HCH transport system permease protein